MKWTKQPGNGSVMICTDKVFAEIEMSIAGCVDVTENVKDEIIEELKESGFDDVEHFDWVDDKGKTYWHIVEPI